MKNAELKTYKLRTLKKEAVEIPQTLRNGEWKDEKKIWQSFARIFEFLVKNPRVLGPIYRPQGIDLQPLDVNPREPTVKMNSCNLRVLNFGGKMAGNNSV